MTLNDGRVDVLALQLDQAILELKKHNIKYNIVKTSPNRPLRNNFEVDESCLYVVRQAYLDDNLCSLTVTARQIR